jgi:drug/metabolite transporter (DMT)-like permease
MFSLIELASLVLVGAFWGCTNPLLRKGSTTVDVAATSTNKAAAGANERSKSSGLSLVNQLGKFRYVSVWLPYAMNQLGSLLFYFTLSKNDLSLTVPSCNALALVFSIVTSWLVLKEPVDRPVQIVSGAALVMCGVAVCVYASEASNTRTEMQSIL